MNKKLKFVRNSAIGAVVLLVLLVSGGIAYTWYMGENAETNSQAFATPGEEIKRPSIEPIKANPTSVVGASVQMITSPVAPGSNASITVRTNPDANCVILVEYDKVSSKDSGLIQKKADEYGVVEWSWTVDKTTPLGTWPVTVTCANMKNSAVVKGDLVVAATAP